MRERLTLLRFGHDRPRTPAATKGGRRASGGLDRQRLVIVAVVSFGLVMPALDTTIVNVALDKLAADLHATLATVQWVATAELIGFRVLQGLGGGMLIPVGFTLVTQSADPKRAGRVLSLVGVPILLGPIFGPILGGLIVDGVRWRWIFFVPVRARVAVPLAGPFHHAFAWVIAASALAVLGGLVLTVAERRARRAAA